MTATVEPILLESRMAEMLADVLGVESVPAIGHFFDDLGADSMLMARFCARVRKQPDLPPVSMKEVYGHPTVASLAAALLERDQGNVDESVNTAPAPAPTPVVRPSTGSSAYIGCAVLQLAVVIAYLYGFALYFTAAYPWLAGGSGAIELYLRVVAVGVGAVVAAAVLPILAKWLLVGRWEVVEFPVWGSAYLSFWTVKTLLRTNPLMLAVGTPLYAVYLRALGADIGPGALILSRHLPVCTDLLTVGAGAIIRRDAFFTCYQAEAGRIRTGTVTIGERGHVGEAAVLGLGTVLGDDAWLGHSSSLGDGETLLIAAGAPGVTGPETTGRRPLLYTVAQLVTTFLVYLPLSIGLFAWIAAMLREHTGLLAGGITAWTTYAIALLVAAGGYLALLVAGFATSVIVPRLLHRLLEPGRTYPLYGLHYWAQRTIERVSNQPLFPRLLGDSSYVVPYLRAIGYDLSEVLQTGSNFGLEIKHDNPHLCTVGRGTMVADGLSMINVDYSGTGFRVARAEIGADSFLGNYIAYPPQAAVGDDCLLATKVTVRMAGERRDGIGLLGSPAFDIPRSVRRDARFGPLGAADLRIALHAKNRHNLVGIALYAGAWWLHLAELLILATVAAAVSSVIGPLAFALAGVAAIALRVVHFALAERATTGFRALQPLTCSIYDRRFWRHERFWKMAQQQLILDGTPYKSLTWRLMGVRIGRRVFDDGCAIVEKTLTTIGDDCTLNVRSIVQAHSQEDGWFKSDRIMIGAGCTLGTASLVHYGTTLGEGVVLAADAFLMKGQEAPAPTRWAGNPARELS